MVEGGLRSALTGRSRPRTFVRACCSPAGVACCGPLREPGHSAAACPVLVPCPKIRDIAVLCGGWTQRPHPMHQATLTRREPEDETLWLDHEPRHRRRGSRG